NVVRSDGVNGKKKIIIEDRAGHDAPGGAVPVQGEGKVSEGAGIRRVTDRPDISGADDRDCLENIGKAGHVWAWNNFPRSAIPVFDQGAISAADSCLPNRPHVV